MDGHKNPGVIESEIMMLRAVRDVSILILEGENDIRFWEPFKENGCELVNAEGKPNVLGAIQRLDANGHIGVLGIVDSDYDIVEGTELQSKNLLRTDCFDLECTLSRFDALRKVAVNFGDPTKVEKFESTSFRSINQEIIEKAAMIGRIRWAAFREGIRLDTNNMRIQRFIDDLTWEFKSLDLVSSVVLNSDDKRDLEEAITELPEHSPWLVSNGHDVIELLRLGLRSVLGNLRPHVSSNSLAAALRAAVSRDEIESTDLWKSIREWELRNSGFKILE